MNDLPFFPGDYYKFSSTNEKSRVWVSATHSEVFSFKVRSSAYVQVTFSSAFGRAVNESSYILTVEESDEKVTSLSSLGKKDEITSIKGLSLLSENNFMDMWVFIYSNGVRFGTGIPFDNELLFLQQASVFPISGVMFWSADDDAEWIVSKDMG